MEKAKACECCGARLIVLRRPRENGESAAWLWGVAAYWMQAFFALGLVVSAPLLWLAWGLAPAPEERSGGHEHYSGKDYA